MAASSTKPGQLSVQGRGPAGRLVAGRLFAATALIVGLSGCQSIDVNSSNATQVRFVDANSSANATGLDFYENNNAALAYNLGFGYATSYLQLGPNNYTIQAEQSGTRTVLAQASGTFAPLKTYTVLVGPVAAGLQETILQDQNSPAPSGQIAVRVLDQATKVGAIDVYLVVNGGKLSTTTPFLTNINFGTNTGYLNIPAGTYSIAVVPTGTVPTTTTTTLYTGTQVGYTAGAVRTIVLIDAQLTSTPAVNAMVLPDYDVP